MCDLTSHTDKRDHTLQATQIYTAYEKGEEGFGSERGSVSPLKP